MCTFLGYFMVPFCRHLVESVARFGGLAARDAGSTGGPPQPLRLKPEAGVQHDVEIDVLVHVRCRKCGFDEPGRVAEIDEAPVDERDDADVRIAAHVPLDPEARSDGARVVDDARIDREAGPGAARLAALV